MCGIVGYSGKNQVVPILMSGLEKLEYRGYDSAGIAVFEEDGIEVYKTRGHLAKLRSKIEDKNIKGTMGIGHTRWATHGEPSDVNSHPHISSSGKFVVVHNGIIENYIKLKEFLMSKGLIFRSETDTEIIANMMEYYFDGDLLTTASKVISLLEGSYALGIMYTDDKTRIIAAKKDSPLILGISDDGNYIASDIPAILQYTRNVIYLEDNELVELKADGVRIFDKYLSEVHKEVSVVTWDVDAAEKGGYSHFMFKEIMEQPDAIRKTVRGRIAEGLKLPEIKISDEKLAGFDKIYIVACGSAYHVGVLGKYIIEKYVRKPVETVLASEFRYSSPLVDNNSMVIIISQSGETADSIAALRESKRLGAYVLSIVNVVGSTIANLSDDVIYTMAGPEIAVATTKAYSTQLSVMYLLAIKMGLIKKTISPEDGARYMEEVNSIPEKLKIILENHEKLQYYASLFYNSRSIFFIGRNTDYAVALEGSLKLKEISYIHSEAYAAGELKHGTISLIENGTLVVALSAAQELSEKMISNIKEVKARGAVVLAFAGKNSPEVAKVADHVFELPEGGDLIMPSLEVVPLQIFAYYVASLKGCDIDKPRNLAKSVTVE